jgi:hypothetical protein
MENDRRANNNTDRDRFAMTNNNTRYVDNHDQRKDRPSSHGRR